MRRFRCVHAAGFSSSFAFFLAFAVGACGSSAEPSVGAGPGGSSATGGQAASPGGMGGSVIGSAGSGSGGVAGTPGGGTFAAGSDAGGSSPGGTSSGGTVSAGGGSGSGGSAGSGGTAGLDRTRRKLLLRDEGKSAVHYVDLADASKNWHQAVPVGRDLQVIGAQRFLIGTDNGFQERNLGDGAVVKDVTAYPGTLAAHRLHNGNTLLSGVDFHGGKGIVLVEITPQGSVGRQIEYPGTYVRMVREVGADHFLITADTHVFEGDAQGKVVWDVTVQGGPAEPHAWEALRLASGDTLVSTGYAASLELFGADKQLKQTITGGDGVKPNFFADVQVMPGSSYVVANWQGHGVSLGANGLQVVEYDAAGKLVWSWKQDASFVSSLQQLVVLDGLDLDKLHVENRQTGLLEPVN
jgi:hypothetical protein